MCVSFCRNDGERCHEFGDSDPGFCTEDRLVPGGAGCCTRTEYDAVGKFWEGCKTIGT